MSLRFSLYLRLYNKNLGTTLLSAIFAYCTSFSAVYANPTGGQVVGGAGSINQSGATTTINQSTQNMAINWQSYNVQQNERVQYIQPNSSSVSLNRILSSNGSIIAGNIDANGQVILVNPNGVFFTPTATINVGGIIASGLDISPTDFMNGNYIFNEVLGTSGAVINSGTINASLGGQGGGNVALIGKQVKNDGLIVASLGTVSLAAGKQAVLTFDNGGLLGVRISKEILQNELGVDPAVLNEGTINAAGGRVLMSASVSQDVFSQAVNTSGIDQATSVVVHADGSFTLGGGADVVNSGTIDTSTNSANTTTTSNSTSTSTNTTTTKTTSNNTGVTGNVTTTTTTTSTTSNSNNTGRIVLVGENVTSSGTLKADNTNGNGGEIELHSQDTTLLTQNSITSARSEANGTGGVVKVLGDKVGLFDQATVDVSGANGGGTALIGGDQQGGNANIRNANFIYLSELSKVYADAIDKGNGGKLITFAQDTARIYGNLYARGGTNGGNGGFIETSGLRSFDILNAPDVSAANGQGGEWLIDPYDITITSNSTNNRYSQSSGTFTPTNTNSRLDVDTVRDALNNGASITIQTTGTGTSGNGDIIFDLNGDLDYNNREQSTLTLNAARDIKFEAGSRIYDSNEDNNSGNGFDSINLVLNAARNVVLEEAGSGQSAASIKTNGGYFYVGSSSNQVVDFINNGIVNTLGGDNDTSNSSYEVRKVGGDVRIFASGAVTNRENGVTGADGTILTGGGNFYVGTDGTTVDRVATFTNNNVVNTGAPSSCGDNACYDGGDVSVYTTGNISTNNILTKGTDDTSTNSAPDNGGNGGDITLDTNGVSSTITTSGAIDTSGGIDTDGFTRTAGHAGFISLTAAGGITLGGNINAKGGTTSNSGTDGNGANIILNGPVQLSGNTINLDASGVTRGNICVGNSCTPTSRSTIDLNSGNGNLNMIGNNIFTGAVGNGTKIGNLNINATGNVDLLANSIVANSFTVQDGATQFISGDITTSNNTATGGAISINANTITVGALDSSANATGAAGQIALIANDTGTANIILNNDVIRNGSGTTGTATINMTGSTNGTVYINHIPVSGTNSFTSALAITGSSGTDTINAAARNNTWALTSGTSSLNTNLSFTSMETLFGNTGQDIFQLPDSSQFTGTINGNGGSTDEVQGGNRTNSWAVTGSNSGTVTGLSGGFSGIQVLTGNAGQDNLQLGNAGNFSGSYDGAGGTDTVTGGDRANTWTITNTDEASVTGITGGLRGVEALVGNNNQDIFQLHDSFNFAGTLNGGGGSTNRIVGGTGANIFNITATNVGNVNGVGSNDFTNIQQLVGNTGNDTFNITPAMPAGMTVDGAGVGDNDIVNLNGGGTITIGTTANNIETFNGNDTGATANSTLVAGNTDNTWTIDRQNGGTIDDTTTPYTYTFTNFGNVTGGSGANTFDFSTSATSAITGRVDGGGGSNTIRARSGVNNIWAFASATSGRITQDNSALPGPPPNEIYVNDFQNVQSFVDSGSAWADISGLSGPVNVASYTGFEGIFGNTGITLGGRNANSTWTFEQVTAVTPPAYATAANDGVGDGVYLGGGQTLYFVNFANFQGGSANDVFNMTTPVVPVAGSITISDIGGTNRLQGRGLNNTWTITSANAGNVLDGVNGQYVSFSGIQNLTGGSNDDLFSFDINSSISGLIDGGAHTGTVGDQVNMSQLTTSTVDVVLGQDVTNVESIIGNDTNATLTGQNIQNNWAITGNDSGTVGAVTFSGFYNLTGGSADDNFIFSPGSSLTGIINGGGQTLQDSVDMAQLAAANVVIGQDITNIELITANGNGSLTGANTANTWTITGANNGNVGSVAFIGFNNLTGGNNDDTFIFNSGSSINGLIDGGAHVTRDTIDQSQLANVNITVGATGFNNIERYIGNNTTSTLTGANMASTWTINGTNDGNINGNITFVDFNNLTGGNNDDTFVFTPAGSITGLISGGGQALRDTVDLSQLATVNVNLSQTGVYSGIEQFIGNNTASTLTGANVANTWTITGANDGNVNGIAFVDFNNLTGGSNDDSFNFNVGSSIAGLIDGGAHLVQDTINQSLLANVNITIGATGFNNIERYVGNNTNSTLTGANTANTWAITGANDGNINGNITFVDFNNLTGGNNDDSFNFSATGSISGLINGGGQLVQDTVNLSQLATANVNLSQTNVYTGIEQFIGNYTASTLTGADTANTWTITGDNDGNVNGIAFVDFNNLTGGSNDDTFVITPTGSVTGLINGGGQTTRDTVDLSQHANVSVNLSQTGVYTNIERYVGNNATSTFTGANTANTWTITGANNGDVNGGITFVGFNNIIGGSNDDTFNFNTGSSISGFINGGGQLVRDTVDQSALAVVDLRLGADVMNIERIIGNNTNSTLTGTNNATTWTISGANTGTVGSGVSFVDFNNLTGGSGDDTFNFTASGSLSGLIDGGGQLLRDSVDMSQVTTVALNLGQDVTNIERVVGNGTASTLIGADQNNDWLIDSVNGGTVNSIAFTGFNNLTGGANDDSFTFSGNGDISTVNGMAGFDTFTINNNLSAATLNGGDNNDIFVVSGNVDGVTLNGGMGDDTFTIATSTITDLHINGGTDSPINSLENDTVGTNQFGFTFTLGNAISSGINGVFIDSGIEGLNANNGTLIAQQSSTVNTDWIVNGVDTGIVSDDAGNQLGFSGFSNLVGGDGVDTFDFSANGSITGTVRGGAGNDALNIDLASLQSGSVNFIAGAGADVVTLTGSTGNVTYTPGQAGGYEQLVAGNNFTVNYQMGDSTSLPVPIPVDINDAVSVDVNGNTLFINGLANNTSSELIQVSNNSFTVGGGQQVTYTQANNLNINGLGGVDTVNLNGINLGNAGDLTVDAQTVNSTQVVANVFTLNNVGQFNATGLVTANTVTLTNVGQFGTASSLVNTSLNTLQLQNSNAVYLSESSDLNITSTGDISNSGVFNIVGTTNINAGGNIALNNAANDFDTVTVTSPGAVSLRDIDNIQVGAMSANSVAINASNGSITGGTISASSINLTSSTDVNVVTATSNLTVDTIGGNITIANNQAMQVNMITSAGNIDITNTGNVTVNRLFTNGSSFAPNGSRVDLRVTNGGVFADTTSPTAHSALAAPDIVASDIDVRTGASDMGTPGRYISISADDSFTFFGAQGYVYYYGGRPRVVLGNGNLAEFFGVPDFGQTLIEIESLGDVDPAIFTEVRNYNHEDVAILLPPDQRFTIDEDDDEKKKKKKLTDVELESTKQ